MKKIFKDNRIENSKKLNEIIKIILLFIIFESIFTSITIPILIYHGPFNNVKRIFVETSMTTFSHQWIAELFLSQHEIEEIMKINVNEKNNNIDLNNLGQLNDIVIESDKNNNSIEVYKFKSNKYSGNIIIANDPKKVKVGYTLKLGKEGQTTSKISKEYDAIAAINGGGFSGNTSGAAWSGTGGIPNGIIIADEKVIYNDINNVHEKIDTMAITQKGHLLVGKYSVDDMKKIQVRDALTFGPPLIINGKKTIEKGDGGWGIAPRTAIGQRKDGSIILLVVDGRQVNSIGATLKEIQDILYEFGAYNATNMDGGFSTTMYYDGKVINNPPDILGERAVPSIVYVEK